MHTPLSLTVNAQEPQCATPLSSVFSCVSGRVIIRCVSGNTMRGSNVLIRRVSGNLLKGLLVMH